MFLAVSVHASVRVFGTCHILVPANNKKKIINLNFFWVCPSPDSRPNCECVVIGDCVDETACDSDIISIFDGGHFKILDSLNGVAARKVVMDWQTRKLGLKFCSDVDLERLGQQTAGFSFSDFECLLRKAYGSALARFDIRRLRGHPKVDSKGADEALKEMQSLLADSIGAPKIPDVKWEDIGG